MFELSSKSLNVAESGVSAREPNQSGASPRANGQVNKFNDAAGYKKYGARAIEARSLGRVEAKIREQ